MGWFAKIELEKKSGTIFISFEMFKWEFNLLRKDKGRKKKEGV